MLRGLVKARATNHKVRGQRSEVREKEEKRKETKMTNGASHQNAFHLARRPPGARIGGGVRIQYKGAPQ